jgi:predicted nucleic acid-binding protein
MLDLNTLGLKAGDLVLLDTAPIIYLIDLPGRFPSSPSESDLGRRSVVRFFADSARSGELRLAASAVAWTECLAGPLAAGDRSRADSFRAALADSGFITLEPVDAAIAEETARLMAISGTISDKGSRSKRRLELADAMHIATAAALGAAAILTNDAAWRDIEECASADSRYGGQVYRNIKILLVDELAFDAD